MNKAGLKGLGLSAASVAVFLAVVAASSKLYVAWLDLRDAAFRYENQLDMWSPDPVLGYINKTNFSDLAFGNVSIRTNDRGFRGARAFPVEKADGRLRIVGLGDSVMWGTGVTEAKSILGFLEQLDRGSSYEIINAAVVGYSAYQELLYFEKYILPLAPDIVLVNFCDNDLLPTEDPFQNVREIYLQYLRRLLQGADGALPPDENSGVQQLIRLFEGPGRVWDAMNDLKITSPAQFSLAWKVFVAMPMAKMADLRREAGVRLVYVFLPSQRNQSLYGRISEPLKKLLIEGGAEFVEVGPRSPRRSAS